MSEKNTRDQHEDLQANTVNTYINNAINTPSKETAKRKAIDQNSSKKPKEDKIIKDSLTPASPHTKVTIGETNDTGQGPR